MSLACGGGGVAAGARARHAGAARRTPAAVVVAPPRRAVPCSSSPAAAASSRLRTVSVRAAWRQSTVVAGRGLALSLFHRFRGGLPPEGQVLPPDEESCDPYFESCKTPLHVHESPCPGCGGSGWARAPARARCPHGRGHRGGSGRHAFRGGLHECLCCHGLGYARRATIEAPPETYLTLARPAEADPRSVSAARLRQVLRSGKGGGGSGEGAPAAAAPAAPAAAAATAAAAAAPPSQQQQQQQQQQRQKEREAAFGSLDRTAFWRGVQARWSQQEGGEGGGGAGAGGGGGKAAPPRPPRSASPAPAK